MLDSHCLTLHIGEMFYIRHFSSTQQPHVVVTILDRMVNLDSFFFNVFKVM